MGDLSEETRMEAAGTADHIEHTDKGAVETADHAEERGIEADQLETSLEKLSLGTKKLSGAQKRRLKKAEKIAAGTWVKENPHKTKGQKGKSDQTTGVKRTRSDNSTPTKNPEAKRPKGITKQAANNATRSGNTQTGTVASAKEVRGSKTQTGTYGEVTDKLRMAVVDRRHPEVKLNQEQAELVRTKLEEASKGHCIIGLGVMRTNGRKHNKLKSCSATGVHARTASGRKKKKKCFQNLNEIIASREENF
ncbi:uncharacterized protein LOC126884399 [Diabrotica virgifera virgifera]|uniref:Uncharacterized protein n=1 Tax=Diabrotica virgifera virgifera TaxID=50390 RepID=A0ABM5K7W0_DIAVI|nr:uncharacterized protein LOC126884399 [Diabrotica virgifera virgifera]